MSESVDPRRLKITDEAGSSGTLIGIRCRECGVSVFGPATFCQACTSFEVEPVDLGRQGTLYSYTIVRIPPAGWPGPVPYILGQVELPSGPQVLAEVIDCEQSDLIIGMPVELAIQAGSGPRGRRGQAGLQVAASFRGDALTLTLSQRERGFSSPSPLGIRNSRFL